MKAVYVENLISHEDYWYVNVPVWATSIYGYRDGTPKYAECEPSRIKMLIDGPVFENGIKPVGQFINDVQDYKYFYQYRVSKNLDSWCIISVVGPFEENILPWTYKNLVRRLVVIHVVHYSKLTGINRYFDWVETHGSETDINRKEFDKTVDIEVKDLFEYYRWLYYDAIVKNSKGESEVKPKEHKPKETKREQEYHKHDKIRSMVGYPMLEFGYVDRDGSIQYTTSWNGTSLNVPEPIVAWSGCVRVYDGVTNDQIINHIDEIIDLVMFATPKKKRVPREKINVDTLRIETAQYTGDRILCFMLSKKEKRRKRNEI